MATGEAAEHRGPAIIIGAGYAGLATALEVHRRSRGTIPVVVIDRHPVHVLRTELYEVGRLASSKGRVDRWVVPLATALDKTGIDVRTGVVDGIDLDRAEVRLGPETIRYGALALCLGNVPAYYNVPGASEHTDSVYHLTSAMRLAERLEEAASRSADLPGERRLRIVIVGGGSTGTEVAAEIATTDWSKVTGRPARPFEVVLVTGALPFLAGLPGPLVDRARRGLASAGVAMITGTNASRVEPGRLTLEDGTVLPAERIVWCAGLTAPPLVAPLPTPHGKGGRLRVEPTLELPGRPGVFGVGDVIEFTDPATGLSVPGTAQAAIAEARVAGRNLVARWNGEPLEPFRYREKGAVVALGRRGAAGAIRGVSVWGRPASLVKRLVEREYAHAVSRGTEPKTL